MINPVMLSHLLHEFCVRRLEDVHLCGTQSNGTGLNSVMGLYTLIMDKRKIGSVSPE